MNEKIFDRIEKKYLINKNQYELLHEIIIRNMQKDVYYKSTIYNIYYDTDNFDFIIASADHPHFKTKLRARSYEGYDKVFMELKTKIDAAAYKTKELIDEDGDKENNVGFKRRALITHEDYKNLGKKSLEDFAANNQDKQIAKEIDYFMNHFNVKPKILVYYNRESFVNDEGLRITFDSNLKYRNKNLEFTENSRDPAYFKNGEMIMEIKAHDALPLWLVRELSKQKIYPVRFSKINNIYERIKNV